MYTIYSKTELVFNEDRIAHLDIVFYNIFAGDYF